MQAYGNFEITYIKQFNSWPINASAILKKIFFRHFLVSNIFFHDMSWSHSISKPKTP